MRVYEGRGSSEGDGNAIEGGCLKVYLKNNRKILTVDCTLASARPPPKQTHNTHSDYDNHTKCSGPLCLVNLKSVNQLSCSLDSMQSHGVCDNCKRRHFLRLAPQCFALTSNYCISVTYCLS